MARALMCDIDSVGAVRFRLVGRDRRVRLKRVEPLDPLGAPGRRLPAIAEVNPLADDLLIPELHDADDHHRLVVVADRVLVDPEVVAAGGPVELEVLAGWVRRPHRDDVRLAAQALAALWPLDDSVVGVDLRGADDVVCWSAAGGADVRGVEVRLDHGPCSRFGHREPLLVRTRPGPGPPSSRGERRRPVTLSRRARDANWCSTCRSVSARPCRPQSPGDATARLRARDRPARWASGSSMTPGHAGERRRDGGARSFASVSTRAARAWGLPRWRSSPVPRTLATVERGFLTASGH